jgi:site-specific DNA-methyltransferase (adenine-specific)
MSPAELIALPINISIRQIDKALETLDVLRIDLDSAETFEEIRQLQNGARRLGAWFSEIQDVRRAAERTVLIGEHRIGGELNKQPRAKGARGQLNGRSASGGALKSPPENKPATLTKIVGNKFYGLRLKRLAQISRGDLERAIDVIHESHHEATVVAVLKLFAGRVSRDRREASRSAAPIPDGMDYRVGDARAVLADISDNSVPLILTDPPYGNDAEPLYQWLAQWASRVLIPGGSLICYTGQSRLNRDIAIFGKQLTYWWLCVMPHGDAQRLPGRFVTAKFKPVLWYVKNHRRGRSLMPDMLVSPKKEKLAHDWAQGEGGVWVPIEHLTKPGELIVDPFAGTGRWGQIAIAMGRRWIGADIVQGGSKTVLAA